MSDVNSPDFARIEAAIKKTEYKYFGDYEMSDDQRDAVDVLVECGRRVLASFKDTPHAK